MSQTASSTPTFPAPSTPTTRVQAETGTLSGSGMSVRSDLSGYEGAGHVGSFTDAGDKLAVNFPDMAAGTYDIRIRHRGALQHNPAQIDNGQLRDVGWFYVDYIEIVLSSAPSTDTPTRKQAENGILTGVIPQTHVPGYEGNGYVGPFANAGDQVAVSFSGVAAGNYDIRIRYNAGLISRTLSS